MQFCITGANGFIGRHLLEALSTSGHKIKILTRMHSNAFPSNAEIIIGDLTRDDCPLDRFLAGCDVLFHCAGEVRESNLMHALHVDGTQRLIAAALHECISSDKKIHWVQLSSCGAYGPPQGGPGTARVVSEQTPTHPGNIYESTKTRSDELVIEACANGQMTYSILRPSIVFGSKMTSNSLRKLIQLIKRGFFFYLGKPGAIVTYVHVTDVVAALELLAADDRAKNEIYNLSSDCTLEQLVEQIALLLEVRKPTIYIYTPLVRIPLLLLSRLLRNRRHIPTLDALLLRTHYSSDKIESELDYKFSMPMPMSIEEMIKH